MNWSAKVPNWTWNLFQRPACSTIWPREVPGHAQAGGKMIREMGFPLVAELVEAHVDMDVPEAGPVTETEIVYLSDKLVSG